MEFIYQNNFRFRNREFLIRKLYVRIQSFEIAKTRIILYTKDIKEKGLGTAIPNPFLNKNRQSKHLPMSSCKLYHIIAF